MTQRTSYEPGTPSWVDLMSPDVDASAAFYAQLFGWDADEQHDDEGNRIYVLFRQDGQDVAGLGGYPPEMPPMPPVWNTYVAVADADETTARVDAAGGKVMMPPMDVMTAGRMAMYADPSGAMISVWQAGDHIGAQLVSEPNSFTWCELLTRDLAAAKPFYSAVFGWEYDVVEMPDPYTLVRGGENGLAGMMDMPPGVPEQAPNHWSIYFAVADLDATIARLRELGGQTVMEPIEVPGVGRMVAAHDPLGGSFSVMQAADA